MMENKLTLRNIIDNMNVTPEERQDYLNRNWGIDLDQPLQQADLNILSNVFNWVKDKDDNVILDKYSGLPKLETTDSKLKESESKLIRKSQKKTN